MEDLLWIEIVHCEGEIYDYDIPELKDEQFDFNSYLNSSIDY